MMKKVQASNPVRRIASKLLSLFALGAVVNDRSLPYWDHLTSSRLGDRSQWGFDVHKAHLHRIKHLRRR